MTRILEESRQFYESRLAPAIRRAFPGFADRIAAGVVGEGSDCFGYDDEISRDHDYGVGASLWLCDADAGVIGQELQQLYEEELTAWLQSPVGDRDDHGVMSAYISRDAAASTNTPDTLTPHWEALCDHNISGSSEDPLQKRLRMRRGVQTTRRFYSGLLGFDIDPGDPAISNAMWFYTEEWKFAAAVNGAVFADPLGQFGGVRRLLLGYYPERIWRMRLTNALHDFAGSMQANYARCMMRRDLVAANACRTRAMDAAMDIRFLLSRRYAPYYKWKFRALQGLEGSTALSALLERAAQLPLDTAPWVGFTYDPRLVHTEDPLVRCFEEIAERIAAELREQGLSSSQETFLEAHCAEIAAGV